MAENTCHGIGRPPGGCFVRHLMLTYDWKGAVLLFLGSTRRKRAQIMLRGRQADSTCSFVCQKSLQCTDRRTDHFSLSVPSPTSPECSL